MSQPLLSLIASIGLLVMGLITLINLYLHNRKINLLMNEKKQQSTKHKMEMEAQELELTTKHKIAMEAQELEIKALKSKRKRTSNLRRNNIPEVWLCIDDELHISLTSLAIRNAKKSQDKIDIPNLYHRFLLSLCGINLPIYDDHNKSPLTPLHIPPGHIKLEPVLRTKIISTVWSRDVQPYESPIASFSKTLSKLRKKMQEEFDNFHTYINDDDGTTHLQLNPLRSASKVNLAR